MRHLLLSLTLVLPAAAPSAAPPAVTSPAVLKLIDRLGDEDAEARKEAEKKLEALGEDVLPALAEASKKHPDIDTRLRAMVVARTIRAQSWGLITAVGPGAKLKERPRFGGYWLNRVALSKDGRYAVAAGGGLILYDLETGKEAGRVLEVGGARPGLEVSKDGKYALTSHLNAVDFHLVEIPSLKTTQTFKGHKGGVSSVTLSPDGKRAASASTDGTVRLWDVATGKETARLFEFKGSMARVRFSLDGKRVMVGAPAGGAGARLHLFDAESRKEVKEFRGHGQHVTEVRFLPDGKRAVASDTDGQLILWDLESGKAVRTMKHGGHVNDVAVSPDGRRALSAGMADSKVKLWDLRTGKLIESFDGHMGGVLGVGFSRDGRRAVSCDTVCAVRVWRLGK